MQRSVALVVLDIDKGFLHLGENLHNFKASNLASNVQRCLTLLGPRVYIRELFDQQFDNLFIFSFDRIMQRLKVLVVLKVDICTIVLVLDLIEQVSHYAQLIFLDCLNQLFVSFEFNVPPVLPRGLVGLLQNLGNSPLLLLNTQVLQDLLLILDGFFHLRRQDQCVVLSVSVLHNCQGFFLIVCWRLVQLGFKGQ